jgi:hypothetical protein
VLLTFMAVSNRTYSIQFSDSMPNGAWLSLTNILPTTTNRLQTVMDPAPADNRFYRVVIPRSP